MKNDKYTSYIQKKFPLYLMNGRFESFEGILDNDLIDSHTNQEDVINSHFLSNKRVRRFLSDELQNLRRIHSKTEKNSQRKREIDGQINWNQTFKQPHKNGYVVHDIKKDYENAHNAVLVNFTRISNQIIKENKKFFQKNFEDSKQIEENIKRILFNNEYLEDNLPRPTMREIRKVKNSRKSIYRQAAEHLETYLMVTKEGDRKAAEKLFSSVIIPSTEDRAFEIAVLFRITEMLRENGYELLSTSNIDYGRDNEIFILKNKEEKIKIYFNQSGPYDLKYSDEDQKIGEYKDNTANHYFDSSSRDASRRPDVIIESDTYKPLIIEVKESKLTNTIMTGVEECLRYLKDIERDGREVFTDYGSGSNGIVIGKNLDLDKDHNTDIPINVIDFNSISDISFLLARRKQIEGSKSFVGELKEKTKIFKK